METYVFDSIYILWEIRSEIRDHNPHRQSQRFTPQLTISSKAPCIPNLGIRWRVASFTARPLYYRRGSVLIGHQVGWAQEPIYKLYWTKKHKKAGLHAKRTQIIRRPARSLVIMTEQSWLHILDRMGGEDVWTFLGML